KPELAELLKDGSGRAIAATHACADRAAKAPRRPADRQEPSSPRAGTARCAIAIALTAPAAPARYPLLVIIGVLGLGGALAAAGALIGRRAARIAMFAGVGVLAVPTMLWGAWIAT